MFTGIVTRTRPYRDSDLLVDFITGDHGRVCAVARGARKSKRRFGGALEIGAHLELNLTRRRDSGLYTLVGCDIISVPRKARTDLGRFYQLAYVLEVSAALSQEGATAWGNMRALLTYVERLESETPQHSTLVGWELTRLEENGFGLRFTPCQISGTVPNALSVSNGGAVNGIQVRANDVYPVSQDALRLLHTIQQGEAENASLDIHGEVRRAVNHIWEHVLEKQLKSTAFLGPAVFDPPRSIT